MLSGNLLGAASFDKDYGLVLTSLNENVHPRMVKVFLKDIVYIAAEDVSLNLDEARMQRILGATDGFLSLLQGQAASSYPDSSHNLQPIVPFTQPSHSGYYHEGMHSNPQAPNLYTQRPVYTHCSMASFTWALLLHCSIT
ncbi:hypothetical protein GOP47_0005278 [Adiantum capillus-veneris]|uniref:Uncharacterized protein n=1 Tax=Adiantum capillus-veneris TaxID=13818 RepID=A0A9D4V4U8_ADICA|nr:hypothetical protein GOP47_0005278 [Adiantum capillus-veneris]